MKRESLLIHIFDAHHCKLVREDKTGYTVVRNLANEKMSGVPKANKKGNVRPITVCKICNQLDIPVPDIVQHIQPIVDMIDKDVKNKSK